MQPIVREQFLRNLEQSGLMAAEQVAALLESLPSKESAEENPGDGCALAMRLVRAGRLTQYQAEQLCRGDTGMLTFDEYVVLDRLGAGGMGEVLKAEHRSMGRLVAVKVLTPKRVDSPEAVKRFQREVRVAARLIHPNIVTAFDAREHAGRHCLVMEYVEGHDLGQIVKRHGPLPVAEAVDYVIQAARGLQFAHENGIVHRDIKPANLLLQSPSSSSGSATPRGGQKAIVKILDMGLARLDDPASGGEDDDQLTGSSQVMGTRDYMAPEQALAARNVDHRADIYSLGCTLYRLVTGKRPWAGATPVQVLMAHREAPILSLREGRDDVSPQLDAVYQRMIAPKPEDRQQSMAELIEQLSACCAPEEADDGPSDSGLTALLHEAAAQSPGAGLARAAGPSSNARAGGHPSIGAGRSTVAGAALAPTNSRVRSLWPFLLAAGLVMVVVALGGLLATVLRPANPTGERVAVRIERSLAPPPAVAPFDAAAARKHQEAWAAQLGKPLEIENAIGMKFLLIPPGELMMGSTEGEVAQLLGEAKERQVEQWYLYRLPSEAPRHRVRITRPFYLGVYEVMQAEYEQVMGVNPSVFSAEGEAAAKVAGMDTSHHPVEMVSWNDAKAFCEKLSVLPEEQAAGRVYVLPTEGQWEYACRAGTTTKWSCGNDEGVLRDHARFNRNSDERTHGVGERRPNAFGLFDMHGNVREWCADWYALDYYAASLVDDPPGPASGTYRVRRGGSWGSFAATCRAADRDASDPTFRSSNGGFRVALLVADED